MVALLIEDMLRQEHHLANVEQPLDKRQKRLIEEDGRCQRLFNELSMRRLFESDGGRSEPGRFPCQCEDSQKLLSWR